MATIGGADARRKCQNRRERGCVVVMAHSRSASLSGIVVARRGSLLSFAVARCYSPKIAVTRHCSPEIAVIFTIAYRGLILLADACHHSPGIAVARCCSPGLTIARHGSPWLAGNRRRSPEFAFAHSGLLSCRLLWITVARRESPLFAGIIVAGRRLLLSRAQ